MTARTLSIWSVAIVVSLGATTLISNGMSASMPSLPQQPRDPRPNLARPATDEEKQLAAIVASRPQDWRSAQQLAKLQERRGALARAEATLRRSAEAAPTESARWQALAALYNRAGLFERAVETLEDAAERNPANASTHHLVATFYFAKLSDAALRPADRLSYIQRGLAAEERALTAEPEFVNAIVYKSLLLRAQADNESNAAHRAALVRQADDLRSLVGKTQQTTSSASLEIDNLTAYPEPPPPPPVPGAGVIEWVYAETSFAAADGRSTPKKIHDVRPVYPPMAIRMGLVGRVVLQATIDARGYIVSARVIESIPLLNSPTIDAVRQWRFDPATINAAAGAVLINVEARFLSQK